MIWRLTYCNEDGVEARLDIIKGSSTPVEVIEGTATPFALNYKMDKPDKSGFFMTSSADISIFETTSFNIDSLKTSSETEIKVEHYIDNILDWAGFVIPDFFSKTIGSPATVEMVASDRLATLKGVTLTDLNQYVSMRDLAVACLAHTGLSLPLYTLADFGNDGQTNAFFKALGLSSRLSDTKGRNISCYDILKSILVASNSKLVQQDGAWHIVNKWQHEQGAGNLFSNLTSSTPYSEQTINFSDVHVGGRRSIVPVAAITGVYHEFGGGRSYPDNFDFRDFGLIPEFNFPGWTKAGTFNVARGDKEITGYSFDGQMQFGTNTVDSYFFNSNVFNTSNYLQMDGVPVPYTTGQIEVILDLNATAQTVSQFLTNVTAVKIAVGAVKDGSPTIWLNNNGIFAEDNAVIHNLNFDRGATYEAQTKGFNLKGVINNPEGYSIIMRIYGSRDEGEDNRRQIAIHFARIEFKNTQDAPKGIIYKRRQGTDFTKEHDIDTTIFGDYMRKGLDGYFYEYPFDDTSSLYRTAGTLTQPLWTAPNDPEQLPLLQHVTRQKSRMFSLAHNMISVRINVSSFKPLSIFIDCNSERYVVVSATYDFLRSEVEVELEQIAYATLNVRDFIYSYFGDGESGISSVGGISGGGGTGGGLTPEQLEILSFWKKDPDNPNTIFTEMNAYSKLELSAYGVGDSGGSGGSDYERLDAWADYDSSKAGWVLSAFLGNDLNTRVTALENSSGGGGSDYERLDTWADYDSSKAEWVLSAFLGNDLNTRVTALENSGGDSHTHANKAQLDLITQSNIDVLAKLSIVNGNLQIDGNAYATGELSAYGLGTGGGGGGIIETVYGYDKLGQPFNNDILTDTFNAYTINQINTRLVAVENGSATTVNTTGTGNAITSILKSGTVITANKDLTFSLSGHTHTISDITNLQTTLNNKLETSIFNTHNTDNVRHITGAERTKWDAVVTDFENLEIGGRNLWTNSRTIPATVTVGQYGYSSGYKNISELGLKTGELITFSVYVSNIPAGERVQARIDFFRPDGTYTNAQNFQYSISNEGVAYISTFMRDTSEFNRIRYRVMPVNYTANYQVDVVHEKLERGNKPTDWTPAFEDQISDWNTTDVNSFSFIKNKPTLLSQFTDNIGVATHIANTSNPHSVTKAQVGLGNVDNTADSAKNVLSATKLTTARTIAGVSFDGSANIAIPFANLSSKPTTLGGYGITDAVTLNTAQTITGAKTFDANITLGVNRYIKGTDNYAGVWNVDNKLWRFGSSSTGSVSNIRSEKVGIGTDSPSEKLHVVGNILATGTTTTTKVIFNAAGWSMEQVGSELQMKHNNVLKMRFTSTGTIVATNEITAHG